MSATQQPLLNTRGMASAREMRKLRREREVERLRIQRRAHVEVGKPSFIDTEFNLRDESRHWTVYVGNCPMCGIHGPHDMHVKCVTNTGKAFSVKCNDTRCGYTTPPHGSARDAIRHWKLVAALSK